MTMDAKHVIARRVAEELEEGDCVNLGIGLPTLVAAYVPPSVQVFFHSENGIMGMSPLPGEGYEDRNLTDAGGRPVGALPGACAFDSAFSFGIIRGGHLDVTVLGGLEVSSDRQVRAMRACTVTAWRTWRGWACPALGRPPFPASPDSTCGTHVELVHTISGACSRLYHHEGEPHPRHRPANGRRRPFSDRNHHQ